MNILRPYQKNMIDDVNGALLGANRIFTPLLYLNTGIVATGKNIEEIKGE